MIFENLKNMCASEGKQPLVSVLDSGAKVCVGSIDTHSSISCTGTDSGMLTAVFCRNGRLEVETTDCRMAIVGTGDLLLISEEAKIRRFFAVAVPCELIVIETRINSEAEADPFTRQQTEELTKMISSKGGYMRIADRAWYASVADGLSQLGDSGYGPYFALRLMEKLLLLNSTEKEDYRAIDGISPVYVENVYRIRQFIIDNLDKTLSISRLAREFQMSPTYLKEGFKKVYGKPVHEYIQECRLERAAYMLETTNDSIISVASKVGYSGTSRFNVAFKEHFGVTPSKYRKNMR